ncbi:MAG: zeta toxin family protein [Acidimicrobiales bacterium]
MTDVPAGGDPLVELDAQFEDLAAKVVDYGLTWWTANDGVEKQIRLDRSLLDRLETVARSGQIIETADVYLDHDDKWAPQREPLHVDALTAVLDVPGPETSQPTAVFLLGIPGSGKSSVLARIALRFLSNIDATTPRVRDADSFRVRLPEYVGGLGSEVVQTETSDLTYSQTGPYITPSRHLLIDEVGHPDWLEAEVRHFAGRGFDIVILCAEVDIERAVERAKVRATTTGRYVPIAYVRSCAGRPRSALENVLTASAPISAWGLVDTNTATDVGAPALIAGSDVFGAPGSAVAWW